MCEIEACNSVSLPQVDWLIEWDPCSTPVPALAARLDADTATHWEHPRTGNRVAVWEQAVSVEGIHHLVRRVLLLIERGIDRHGQVLIAPYLTLEGWTTSVPAQFDARQVIALHTEHGAHEPFQSEFKVDLDRTRLPSGKFDTNYLVCQLAALAMNILCLMGLLGLLGPDAPVRHSAKRRRIKIMTQELIYRGAARLIEHRYRLIFGRGAADRAANAFARLHGELSAPEA